MKSNLKYSSWNVLFTFASSFFLKLSYISKFYLHQVVLYGLQVLSVSSKPNFTWDQVNEFHKPIKLNKIITRHLPCSLLNNKFSNRIEFANLNLPIREHIRYTQNIKFGKEKALGEHDGIYYYPKRSNKSRQRCGSFNVLCKCVFNKWILKFGKLYVGKREQDESLWTIKYLDIGRWFSKLSQVLPFIFI